METDKNKTKSLNKKGNLYKNRGTRYYNKNHFDSFSQQRHTGEKHEEQGNKTKTFKKKLRINNHKQKKQKKKETGKLIKEKKIKLLWDSNPCDMCSMVYQPGSTCARHRA